MIVVAAINPKFSNQEGSSIDLNVQFDVFPEYLPFTASPVDVEDYGRDLYARAISGEFGAIEPYVAP